VIEAFLAPAFMAWGSPVSWLEIVAFLLSVAMVIGNQSQWIGAWPLAILASLLYGWLFWRGQLYGEALLQGFFIVLAGWGWWQWWRGVQGTPLPVRRMTSRDWRWSLLFLFPAAALMGGVLDHHTDSTLPYLDAWATVGSVLGTVLLARKRLENWGVWVVVNAFSVLLFALKGLWLTVLLYAAFIPLSIWGWHLWRQAMLRENTACV
jgi:nicotinamide mononucleotide transporter